jgi:hypothetical protein
MNERKFEIVALCSLFATLQIPEYQKDRAGQAETLEFNRQHANETMFTSLICITTLMTASCPQYVPAHSRPGRPSQGQRGIKLGLCVVRDSE